MERTERGPGLEANESNAVDHPHQYGHTKDHSSLSFNDGFGISTAFFFFFSFLSQLYHGLLWEAWLFLLVSSGLVFHAS